MKPTIGRIVHYRNTETEAQFQNGAQVVPAIITRVHSDNAVNLTVFTDSGGGVHQKTSVSLGTGAGTWAWPERVEAPKQDTEKASFAR